MDRIRRFDVHRKERASKSHKKLTRWTLHVTAATIHKFIIGNTIEPQNNIQQVIFKAATIRANIQLCSVWHQNVSWDWPMQAVTRLEICTMRINIVLYYWTLLLTSSSNPVTRATEQCKGRFGTHCYFSIICFINHCFLSCVLCCCPHH